MGAERGGRRRAAAAARAGAWAAPQRLLALSICLAAMVSLSACGSSTKKSTDSASISATTAATSSHTLAKSETLHASSIKVTSPSIMKNGAIEPRNTCHGADVSPEIVWHGRGNPLAKEKELLVFVRWIFGGKLHTAWAVGGLSPSLTHLSEGTLPAGAIQGRNEAGTDSYSLCPNKEAFITMAVYTLPHKLHLQPGFDPETVRVELDGGEEQWGGLTLVAYVPPGATDVAP